MEGTRRLRRVVWLLATGLIAVTVVPAVASPEGQIAAALVSEESYRHILDDMLYTHDGDNRDAAWGDEHDPARDNIAALMTSYGLAVEMQAFPWFGYTGHNVVGMKLGTVHPDQEYIIGAHYDSVDNPGADDNASGVALVLEAARVLSTYDSDYTIRFIAFDAEEWGLWGSEAYVDEHIADDILGMISTDMVAYNKGTNAVDIFGFSESNPLKDAVAEAVNTYGEGVTPYVGGSSGGSDHFPFELAGFQACLFIEDWGNPYYHDPEDNVDMPNYIDYTYATRNTRAIVGFLVDHAGVDIIAPDGDYDLDGDVDTDDYNAFVSCFTGPGIPPDPGCEFFDFLVDGDVDCTDWSLFESVWTGPPSEPPVFWRCVILPPVAVAVGNRCLSITLPEHGLPIALHVTGDPDNPDVHCLLRYVQATGQLGETPVFRPHDAWGTVVVCDESIFPGTSYTVQCDYGEEGSPVLSSGVSAITEIWGDVAGDFAGGEWLPPDGTVDFNDISSVVDKFRNLPGTPPAYRAELVGPSGAECYPDATTIDFVDISADVDAFRGLSYWTSTGCPAVCD